MNGKPQVAYVIAANHQQFAECNNALIRLGIQQVVRITAPDNLRGVKGRRYIALPKWSTAFSSHELQLFRELGRTNKHSLYTLSQAKFDKLLAEAHEHFNAIQALKSDLAESKEGGDFPDA